MFKKRLIRNIGQKKSKKPTIIRSQEKWRPTRPKKASGKALNPQGINRMIFGFINQMARIRV